jgi:beta-lactamase regulating signal transducer with metallopeptidase domain
MSENLWIELSAAASSVGLSVAVSALLIAIAALAVAQTFRSAIVRRTAWQIAVLATLGCVALELSGIGQASLAALDASIRESSTRTDAARLLPAALPHDPVLNLTNDFATGAPWTVSTEPHTSRFADSRGIDTTFASYIDLHADSAVSDLAALPQVNSQSAVDGERTVHAHPDDEPTSVLAALLAVIWIVGAGALILRGLVARCGMASLVRDLPAYMDADDQTAGDVRELSARLRFRRRVRLVALPAGSSPIAFGIFRPTIGLPGDFSRRFSPEQRQAILAHELAHLAGGDPVWRSLSDALVAALWWHPASWFVRRRLIDASEAVADEASRAIPGGAEQLASALVVLGKRLAKRRAVRAAYGAEGEFRSSLGRRVERLLAECESPWRPISSSKLAIARIMCGVMVVLVVLSAGYAQRHHLSSTQGDSDMNTFAASWRQSLCGVALAMLSSGQATADMPAEATIRDAEFVAVLQDDEGESPRDRETDRPKDGERDAAARAKAEHPEVRELHQRLRDIRVQLRELGDGKPETAAELRQQAERVTARLNELQAELREGTRRVESREGNERSPGAEPRREAQNIAMRIERLRNRLRELGEGKPEESRELQAQVERLSNRLRELRDNAEREEGDRPDRDRPDRNRPEGDRPGRDASPESRHREAREVRAKLDTIHEHIRAIGGNDPEEAERLRFEAMALASRLHELLAPDAERPRERRNGDERPIVDRDTWKARHVRTAIDHLRAAGMQEEADELYRENEEILRKLPDRGERVPPRREDRPGRPGDERPANPNNPGRPLRPGAADGPGRPDGPPRDGDRPRPGRRDGERREGEGREGDRPRDDDRPRAERPGRQDGPEGNRRPSIERRDEKAARDAADSHDTNRGARSTDVATRTYEVQREETAYDIARRELGRVSRWREILELNREQLGGDIDTIKPGMKLVLPSNDAAAKSRDAALAAEKQRSREVELLREEIRLAQQERDRTLLQLVKMADRAHIQEVEQKKLREQAEEAKQKLDATIAKFAAARAELQTESVKLREMIRALQASLTQKEAELSELRKAKPRDDEQRDKEAQLDRARKLLEDANRQLEVRVREEQRLRESMEKVARPKEDDAKRDSSANPANDIRSELAKRQADENDNKANLERAELDLRNKIEDAKRAERTAHEARAKQTEIEISALRAKVDDLLQLTKTQTAELQKLRELEKKSQDRNATIAPPAAELEAQRLKLEKSQQLLEEAARQYQERQDSQNHEIADGMRAEQSKIGAVRAQFYKQLQELQEIETQSSRSQKDPSRFAAPADAAVDAKRRDFEDAREAYKKVTTQLEAREAAFRELLGTRKAAIQDLKAEIRRVMEASETGGDAKAKQAGAEASE